MARQPKFGDILVYPNGSHRVMFVVVDDPGAYRWLLWLSEEVGGYQPFTLVRWVIGWVGWLYEDTKEAVG